MAGANIDFKRNLLRGIAWDAEDADMDLVDALKAACRARYEETKTGAVLVSASGNGAAVTFALPSAAATLTPETVSGACSQLYDLFEEATAELVAEGNATPTDAQLVTRMLLLLKPRNEVFADRSRMQV